MDVAALERRLQKLEDAEAIRELKSRYFAACDAKDAAVMRACFADGKVHIDYGVVGTFDTADALVQVFKQVGCHDYMVEMHHGANPQIEVLDAQRARGSWSLHYFLINTRDHTLTQLGGMYADEYRKTASGWKISSTVFTATSTLVFNIADGSAKALFAGRSAPMPG
ncbi:MAG TPA: nuclear transport factor 2 family protein [Nevskiaceae bacterium]|nr:nuclear transport factor 2 family protein [Nevskiaceae bacterium]